MQLRFTSDRRLSRLRDTAIHWGDPGTALGRLADDEEVPAKDVVSQVEKLVALRGSPRLADVDWDAIDDLLKYAQGQAAAEKLNDALTRAIRQAKAAGVEREQAQEIALNAVEAAYASK